MPTPAQRSPHREPAFYDRFPILFWPTRPHLARESSKPVLGRSIDSPPRGSNTASPATPPYRGREASEEWTEGQRHYPFSYTNTAQAQFSANTGAIHRLHEPLMVGKRQSIQESKIRRNNQCGFGAD
ncbi:hypothetical protein ACOMHN_049976 [Nucella lapillus]